MRGRRFPIGAAIAVAVGIFVTPPAAGASGVATTFTVSGFGDGSAGQCTPPDANGNSVCLTLREAVNQANAQTNTPTIYLGPGTYQLNDPAGQLDLASAMSIVGAGPGGPTGTTIQQTDGQNRVLEVDGASTISGVEITGGHYSPPWSSGRVVYGGGIMVLGTLTLEDSLISNNQALGGAGQTTGDPGDAAVGGGIDYGSTAGAGSMILDSTISGNAALGGAGGSGGSAGGEADGGGIAYDGTGPLTIQNSTISNNVASGGDGGGGVGAGGGGGSGQGGGLFNPRDVTITQSTIDANSATGGAQGPGPTPSSSSGGFGGGGGIFSQAAVDQVVNSTLFGNGAQGGAPSGGGTAGDGYGGGLLAEGPTAALTLQSDTIDANSASSADGNLHSSVGTAPSTIHDTIVAAGSPDNCGISTSATSESNNIEDDTVGQCGFSTANQDLVGANPELPSSLAENGGPTATLAPAPGSPALGAGGSCLDPTSAPPNQPLTVDQRGEPRPTPCDIGAFEAQPPADTARPAISGQVARGQTLICSQGAWTGDGLLTYGFGWLRNGVPIPGATTNTYVVGPADAGQTLACQVTATYYGSTTAASPFAIVVSYPVITVLRVTTTPTGITVALGCRGWFAQRCAGRLRAAVVERRRGGRVIGLAAPSPRNAGVTLGQHGYSILSRHVTTIRIRLRRRVGLLLTQFREVPALLTVTERTAAGTTTVAALHVRIRSTAGTTPRLIRGSTFARAWPPALAHRVSAPRSRSNPRVAPG